VRRPEFLLFKRVHVDEAVAALATGVHRARVRTPEFSVFLNHGLEEV
jgi:hypothetical protein